MKLIHHVCPNLRLVRRSRRRVKIEVKKECGRLLAAVSTARARWTSRRSAAALEPGGRRIRVSDRCHGWRHAPQEVVEGGPGLPERSDQSGTRHHPESATRSASRPVMAGRSAPSIEIDQRVGEQWRWRSTPPPPSDASAIASIKLRACGSCGQARRDAGHIGWLHRRRRGCRHPRARPLLPGVDRPALAGPGWCTDKGPLRAAGHRRHDRFERSQSRPIRTRYAGASSASRCWASINRQSRCSSIGEEGGRGEQRVQDTPSVLMRGQRLHASSATSKPGTLVSAPGRTWSCATRRSASVTIKFFQGLSRLHLLRPPSGVPTATVGTARLLSSCARASRRIRCRFRLRAAGWDTPCSASRAPCSSRTVVPPGG